MELQASKLACVLGLSLGGCATNWYTPPAGQATATLRVAADRASPFFIWTRETTRTCSRDSPNFPVLGPTSKSGQFGNFTAEPGRFEGPIQAGTPFRLYVGGSATASPNPAVQEAYTCSYNLSFTPQPGARYELRLDFSADRCNASLSELRQIGGTISSLPVNAELLRTKTMCP